MGQGETLDKYLGSRTRYARRAAAGIRCPRGRRSRTGGSRGRGAAWSTYSASWEHDAPAVHQDGRLVEGDGGDRADQPDLQHVALRANRQAQPPEKVTEKKTV